MLLGRPWIYATRVVVSPLHQRVNFIINGSLITMIKETLSMIKNVVVSYVETKDNANRNLHVFKVVHVEWVLKNTMIRKPKISKASKIVAK
jgi:hypothetical protein